MLIKHWVFIPFKWVFFCAVKKKQKSWNLKTHTNQTDENEIESDEKGGKEWKTRLRAVTHECWNHFFQHHTMNIMWRARNKVMTSAIINSNTNCALNDFFLLCCSETIVLSLAGTLWHFETRINWQHEKETNLAWFNEMLAKFRVALCVIYRATFLSKWERMVMRVCARAYSRHFTSSFGPTLLKWTINDSIFMITYIHTCETL